jgi:hypothetical protein
MASIDKDAEIKKEVDKIKRHAKLTLETLDALQDKVKSIFPVEYKATSGNEILASTNLRSLNNRKVSESVNMCHALESMLKAL